MGREARSSAGAVRRLDRCAAQVGLPGRHLLGRQRHSKSAARRVTAIRLYFHRSDFIISSLLDSLPIENSHLEYILGIHSLF